MEKKIEDFIGIYEGAASLEFCDTVISQFEKIREQGLTYTRQEMGDLGKHQKDDTSIWTGELISREEADSQSFMNVIGEEFQKIIWSECYPHYAEAFSVLGESDAHTNYGSKVQKTCVGQGYHIWHYESSSRASSNRLLTYILYLNDVEEGGETELLYQRKRIKPKAGTLLIFPAAFTHTHRGNPPLSNDKYIMTGWIEF